VAASTEQLAREGAVVVLGELVADATWWAGLKARAGQRIEQEHRAHQERLGLALSELESELAADLPEAGAFDALVGELLAAGFRRTGTAIQRPSHQPALPPRLQATGQLVRRLLEENPLEPPSRKALEPDYPSQQVLRFLVDTGQAIEVGPDVVLSATAYASALSRVRAHLRQHRQATLSELRQAVGTTRRIMIPLAEKLDRDGITLRVGDQRRLGSEG
jgi:selenocysteine-specific elongation factor